MKKSGSGDGGDYWRANVVVVVGLLAVWLIVAIGVSILGIGFFNQWRIGNVGFGFWMAQQGSIFVFVAIVFAYALIMERLDRRYRQPKSNRNDSGPALPGSALRDSDANRSGSA